MGNIWMFPTRVSLYGGGSFLIPYFIFVVLIASTGVIGVPLPLEPIRNGIDQLVSELDHSIEYGAHISQVISTLDIKHDEEEDDEL